MLQTIIIIIIDIRITYSFNNYEFLGWSVSGSKEYKKHVTIPKGSTGNKYYIARWQGKLINIYFDSNNGSALEPKQSRYNSLLGTLPTPIKESYTFLGWYTQPSGGEQITHSTYTPAMDTTYYAHWEPIKYTITCYKYDENDTIQIENILTYTIESNDMELSIPTRNGYIFNGWIGSDLSTASKSVIIKKGSTGNKKYTGTWTKDPCADGHKYINKINKATTYSNGQILPTCYYCGAKKTSTIIYYPKTISVSCTSYTYDGTNKYPKIVIKTSTGSTLKEKSDYTINYVNNKNVGSGTIKINFIGNYTGTATIEFAIDKAPLVVELSSSNIYTRDENPIDITITTVDNTTISNENIGIKYFVEEKIAVFRASAWLAALLKPFIGTV